LVSRGSYPNADLWSLRGICGELLASVVTTALPILTSKCQLVAELQNRLDDDPVSIKIQGENLPAGLLLFVDDEVAASLVDTTSQDSGTI
jgi:hypothetical protein